MNPFEVYEEECNALLRDVAPFVRIEGVEEVQRLIDHREGPIGLNILAWGIVQDDVKVPASLIARMRGLLEGSTEADDLPPNLDSHGIPGQ